MSGKPTESGPKALVYEPGRRSPTCEDGPHKAWSSTPIVHRGTTGNEMAQERGRCKEPARRECWECCSWPVRETASPLAVPTSRRLPSFLAAGTLVTAVLVNLTRKRRRDRETLDITTTRESWETHLTFYAPLTLAVAYPVHWVFYSPSLPLGPELPGVLTKVFSPPLIIIFVATGRRLVRNNTSV